MNIYVGNIPHQLSEDELREVFEPYGEVISSKIIIDRDSNQSRGFAFVEMPVKSDAEAAIAALNDTEVKGRKITVNEARPRQPKKPGGGGSGGSGGGGRKRRSFNRNFD